MPEAVLESVEKLEDSEWQATHFWELPEFHHVVLDFLGVQFE